MEDSRTNILHSRVLLIATTITAAFVAVIGGAMLYASYQAIIEGRPNLASNIATVANGVTSIGVVVLTLVYVIYTYGLVRSSNNARKEEKRREKEKEKRSKENLRKALYSEITAVNGIERAEGRGANAAIPTDFFPTNVYEPNADKLGSLTEEEAEKIVQYYTAVDSLDSWLEMARSYDLDNPEKVDDMINYYIKTTSVNKRIVVNVLKDNMEDTTEKQRNQTSNDINKQEYSKERQIQ
ncbi:hypothetical protein [Natrinema salinisoli]|uniref:hypothetical protein n=1 Tax=Natrinema salinisoli TaxID=2878535 RepID=UPI001CF00272|nr:hypothetical protein [Natrinema salinisoli]